MNQIKNISRLALFTAVCGFAFAGCQKMGRPELGNYLEDSNPPGGPLKFYAAFDGNDVDSIRATFGDPKNIAYSTGINGQAYKGSSTSYIVYPSANDFSKSTSFTISFWMKKLPHASNAEFVFSLPTTSNIWHKSEMFLLIEDQNQTTTTEAAMKLMIQDQWIEFVGTQRLANVTNGQWHHLAFVYDEATSKLTTYIDGAALTGLPANLTDIKSGGNPRGPLSFTNTSRFVIGGPSHHALGATPDGWMANYSGELDQFRLYNKVLTAAEIQQIFANKL